MPGELVNAIDAALLVEIGKYTVGHIAFPIVSRLWRSRFAGVDAPDVATATARLGAFMDELDARVAILEGEQRLSQERLNGLSRRPEVTGSLYAAFETAIETDDSFKLKTLADLVIARLHATDDSVDEPALRIAIERMRDVTPKQTRLLGLVNLLHVDPLADQYPADGLYDEQILERQREVYIAWLERHVVPLIDLPVEYIDFTHLRGLGLLDFTMWEHTAFEGGFTPTLLNPTVRLFPNLRGDPQVKDLIRKIDATADPLSRDDGIPMMAACTLTPAGYFVAVSALRESSGFGLAG